MATSIIKSGYKKGTVSNSAGTSSLDIRQDGRIVTVNGFMTGVSFTANTEKRICIVSGVDLPTPSVRAVCGVANYAYEVPSASYVTLATTGELFVRTSQSGTKAVYMSFSYTI